MLSNIGQGNCQYTALTTAGTTTLNPGSPLGQSTAGQNVFGGGGPQESGVLYGMLELAAGTTFAATFYDIITTVTGTGTATVTNTLLSGTGTAGQNIPAGPPGIGVRYRGALVVVTSGTPGVINALWD